MDSKRRKVKRERGGLKLEPGPSALPQLKLEQGLTRGLVEYESGGVKRETRKVKLEPKPNLSDSLKFCYEILKVLFSKKHRAIAWPFYAPVDVKKLRLYDYLDVIKQPMDLGTVKRKMENREYSKVAQFAADMHLMFSNCYKYNPKTHDIVIMCEKLESLFENLYAQVPSESEDSSGSSSSGSDSSDSSDSESDFSYLDEEVRGKLGIVQAKLGKLQSQMSNLTEEHRQLLEEQSKQKDAAIKFDARGSVIDGLIVRLQAQEKKLSAEVLNLKHAITQDSDNSSDSDSEPSQGNGLESRLDIAKHKASVVLSKLQDLMAADRQVKRDKKKLQISVEKLHAREQILHQKRIDLENKMAKINGEIAMLMQKKQRPIWTIGQPIGVKKAVRGKDVYEK
ncbi:bromodomain-containing protein 3-like [Drosophila guanche]|uniref:Blast:Homeotic protein female sterile n=1 Tax=Drosophila guanche TaxID=7266 RepID=A0A3B0JAB0_DROGU|nr:bromodomain-containing protein 3-like [Drosophila guanche]SPP79234.1 blast:Homeotic protein female sterile [Drosophila guanche]